MTFLCFLSGRCAFFLANVESDFVIKLCQIFGYNEMKKCAENYSKSLLLLPASPVCSLSTYTLIDRNLDTNLYIPTHRAPLAKLCEHLNKGKMVTWIFFYKALIYWINVWISTTKQELQLHKR